MSSAVGIPTQVTGLSITRYNIIDNNRPLIRFDGSAQDYCYPDEATNANNGRCAGFNPDAPIYYKVDLEARLNGSL